jgi:HSP20 family protein
MKIKKKLYLVIALLALLLLGQSVFTMRLARKVDELGQASRLSVSASPKGGYSPRPAVRGARNMDAQDNFFTGLDWEPFREMERMRREINRMFKNSLGRGSWLGKIDPLTAAPYDLNADLREEDGRYVIRIDIPGMEKEKIDVEIRDGVLYVSGEREIQEQEQQPGFIRRERSFGKFQRSMELPADADSSQIEAYYQKGVLTVVVGKRKVDESAPDAKKIKVL